jgi:signal peptidase II
MVSLKDKRLVKLLLLIVAVVFIDQWTKQVIHSKFELHDSVPVIDSFFNITYVLNPGAAFGFLAGLGEQYRVLFFVIITLLAIILLSYLLVREKRFVLRSYSYALILAGAIGNLIDRIRIGKVVDFLDFYVKGHHWPAFNVADISISVGVGLLILEIVLDINKKSENKS